MIEFLNRIKQINKTNCNINDINFKMFQFKYLIVTSFFYIFYS
jgi:hypothetical protein